MRLLHPFAKFGINFQPQDPLCSHFLCHAAALPLTQVGSSNRVELYTNMRKKCLSTSFGFSLMWINFVVGAATLFATA